LTRNIQTNDIKPSGFSKNEGEPLAKFSMTATDVSMAWRWRKPLRNHFRGPCNIENNDYRLHWTLPSSGCLWGQTCHHFCAGASHRPILA
jgi:hypothetical protein